jgi:FkbM family methyltransferase
MLGALFFPIGTKKKPIKFDSLFIPYIYKEIYFDSLYVDILNQKKDMTIIDVGSNIGITVQHFRDYAKKVYAIEPDSDHFEALKKNKEFNNWDNVELFNIALADKDGEMVLNKFDNNRTCNSLTNNYGNGGEKVQTMRFDTFLKKNKIKEVDFCKFDVENAEDMILRSEGFIKIAPRIKTIEVEFHNQGWQLLVNHMISLGYTARRYDCSAIVVLFTKN